MINWPVPEGAYVCMCARARRCYTLVPAGENERGLAWGQIMPRAESLESPRGLSLRCCCCVERSGLDPSIAVDLSRLHEAAFVRALTREQWKGFATGRSWKKKKTSPIEDRERIVFTRTNVKSLEIICQHEQLSRQFLDSLWFIWTTKMIIF